MKCLRYYQFRFFLKFVMEMLTKRMSKYKEKKVRDKKDIRKTCRNKKTNTYHRWKDPTPHLLLNDLIRVQCIQLRLNPTQPNTSQFNQHAHVQMNKMTQKTVISAYCLDLGQDVIRLMFFQVVHFAIVHCANKTVE